MKKIGIITNEAKDEGFAYTKSVMGWIKSRGGEPVLPNGAAPPQDFFRLCGLIVVLGGDGTILRAARDTAVYGTPILGINLGGLGFLTDADKADGERAVDCAMRGLSRLERRMTLSVNGGPPVLNDVCVSRGAGAKMISPEIFINGEYMDVLRGDGLIVSTPTGSTAYNLSAGGPILKPDSEMIAVTGICPHSLSHRPWVISAEDSVTLRLAGTDGKEAFVSVDGEERETITRGQTLEIRRSPYNALIMRTNDYSFYEILRRKMGKGGAALENQAAL